METDGFEDRLAYCPILKFDVDISSYDRMLYYFSAFGYFQLDWLWTTERVALVSFVATFVESLSTTETVDDNISVPLASMVTAFLCFGY